jgi:tRNA threonylcarbamoyl adenosine modification protein YeaZ
LIAVFSTSSPTASVALFDPNFQLMDSDSREAPMAASGACLSMLQRLLDRTNKNISDIEVFVADIGPGSFTGVKVAVTLAKTLAFATGKKTAGLSSFDLIAPDRPVIVPSRKGEWFLRVPGEDVRRVETLPQTEFLGYGPGISEQVFPEAGRASALLSSIEVVAPELLLPNYIAEPSISTPKRPYVGPGAASA